MRRQRIDRRRGGSPIRNGVARATGTRRAMAGAFMQVRFPTDLTDKEYVNQRSWNEATRPRCPWRKAGKCRLIEKLLKKRPPPAHEIRTDHQRRHASPFGPRCA